ncbi:hypothetical protein NUW54_g9813 [Trametes sanguinea]|uniref:Uncharacterized protein n=1 Tax=Trametes sanguinea TaxID=158606 RepID=A0ACC1P4M2_9APHY|nr:hypothetical protein NUW54_g9813 [Trametes sanguinea]
MAVAIRRRTVLRILALAGFAFLVKLLVSSPASSRSVSGFYSPSDPKEIRKQNVLDIVTGADKQLDARKYEFLQARLGRDERPDLFTDIINDGVEDYWERFQKPYILDPATSHMDEQSVLSSIEQLLSLNGWVAAMCPTLTRPFGQNKYEDAYEDLARQNHLYYVGMVIHSADHFLVDQLAVIVQLAKRLGPSNIFVSMLDYSSSDSTETLTDLCEAVLTLLGVPFRIRRVPGMTEDPSAAYYPLEEAYTRNLVLEPLHELYERRNIKFHRVIWLKGFTCPNDILETIKVSIVNEAAMVCGMDWAEHNGFFIFSDRWRTRDINGDQFRQSKSSAISESSLTSVPPRDTTSAQRYIQHLPFQVFCCESGTHVVDPAQSYYAGISYRAGSDYFNTTSNHADIPERDPDAPCLDSTQAWFCRDLWVWKAKEGMKAFEPEVAAAAAPEAPKTPENAPQLTPPLSPTASSSSSSHPARRGSFLAAFFDFLLVRPDPPTTAVARLFNTLYSYSSIVDTLLQTRWPPTCVNADENAMGRHVRQASGIALAGASRVPAAHTVKNAVQRPVLTEVTTTAVNRTGKSFVILGSDIRALLRREHWALRRVKRAVSHLRVIATFATFVIFTLSDAEHVPRCYSTVIGNNRKAVAILWAMPSSEPRQRSVRSHNAFRVDHIFASQSFIVA